MLQLKHIWTLSESSSGFAIHLYMEKFLITYFDFVHFVFFVYVVF